MLMPPTRIQRYCCKILKETSGKNRFIATGVRWAESIRRKNNRGIYESSNSKTKDRIILANDNDDIRRLFENCQLKSKRVCNPIIDWTDYDVWDFIKSEKILINPLYKCGYNRVGCIGCPMGNLNGRNRDFARYPKYKNAYIRAFDEMLKERKQRNITTYNWGNAQDVLHWWMEDGVLLGQVSIEELEI